MINYIREISFKFPWTGREVIMSKTQRIKEIIIRFLNDEKIHSVKEIKAFIATQTEEIVSEGVTAGCLKTMTTSKVIENVDRGMYRLITVKEKTVDKDTCPKTPGAKTYDELLNLTQKYKEDALRIINGIDITVENKDLIFSAMNLRKKIDSFCEEIKEYKL